MPSLIQIKKLGCTDVDHEPNGTCIDLVAMFVSSRTSGR